MPETPVAAYYRRLFTQDPDWSTPFPNFDEAIRWAKILELLSQAARPSPGGGAGRLRILDLGCGRGWLTRLASVYGQCEGVDPQPGPIDLARRHFPDLVFHVGTAGDLSRRPGFEPYDVIVTSEVIEHVLDKDGFVGEIRECLVPRGHVILTTPRGEVQEKYRRLGFAEQPIEAWVSERGVRALFERHGFEAARHDRAYVPCSAMSFLHRVAASPRVARAAEATRMTWLLRGLQYATALYQVWWFRKRPEVSWSP
jgi:SAM-dependent methyltransferase